MASEATDLSHEELAERLEDAEAELRSLAVELEQMQDRLETLKRVLGRQLDGGTDGD